MKKLLLLLTLAPCTAIGQSYDVLFIGNSYTYSNNLPQQVAGLASSFGDTINYDSSTPGGATFNAHSSNASVSPVGISWKNSIALDSMINLYSGDNSHPSIYGSYLAACTFYSSIFKKSCVGSAFWPVGVDSATAVFLQTVASNTVLDTLSTWNIFNAD
ncbi:MAG TPA: hypothetical protein EYO31_09980, partial [Phycisphaerales bacterium]|nr:hypothetical protein [Phycisphaerales bacterium]